MIIKGDWVTKRVWIDNKELTPDKSLKIVNYSPDGFNWGYGGSGPAQLAFAILLEVAGEEFAKDHYQELLVNLISILPKHNFRTTISDTRYEKGIRELIKK